MSYRHWPNKLPSTKKLKKIQEKFPKLTHRKSLTDKESGKILRNFDTLVTFFNEDPENGGRNKIMDKLLSKKHQKNLRYKVLVGAYVAGRKLLKRRFARDIWNRLVKIIAKKSSKPKIDQEKLVQTVEKLKSSQNSKIFAQARKEIGLQKSQEELDNLR